MKLFKLLVLPVVLSSFALSGCSCSGEPEPTSSSSSTSTSTIPPVDNHKVSGATFAEEFTNYGVIGLDRNLKITATIDLITHSTSEDIKNNVTYECNNGVYRFRAYSGEVLSNEVYIVVDKATLTEDKKANVTTYVSNGSGSYYKNDFVDVPYLGYIKEMCPIMAGIEQEHYAYNATSHRYELTEDVEFNIGMGTGVLSESKIKFTDNKISYYKSSVHTINDTDNETVSECTGFETGIPAIDIPTDIVA